MKPLTPSPDPSLRIVWWNTGLSPTRAPDRATESDIQTSATLLDHLILTEQADLIVLGEVSEGACDGLMRAVIHASEDHVWTKVFHPAGGSNFSFCILSHKHRVPVCAKDAITLELGSRVFRVGYHFVVTPVDAAPIHLVVSHWPSRLFLPGSDSRRTHIAASLRTWLDAEVLSDPAAVNVVLLGDFNDEPFDEGVERYIRASRDHELVRERTSLFYNPFWRHLSAGQDGPVGDASFGTYFHRNAEFSRWRTFDQMIFSSSLLTGGSGWRLDERRTHVLRMPALAMAIASKASVLDHFPIIGHLERVGIHG